MRRSFPAAQAVMRAPFVLALGGLAGCAGSSATPPAVLVSPTVTGIVSETFFVDNQSAAATETGVSLAEVAALAQSQSETRALTVAEDLTPGKPPAMHLAPQEAAFAGTSTSFLSENTSAIAATEGQYAQMWTQDATAMSTYAYVPQ